MANIVPRGYFPMMPFALSFFSIINGEKIDYFANMTKYFL